MPLIEESDEHRQGILRAVIDRIIPPDDFPGAWDAGAGRYITHQLAGQLAHLAPEIDEGLVCLDREALHSSNQPFASLGPEAQDRLLAQVEEGDVQTLWGTLPDEFFTLLVRLTNEGYYSDPSNGGNRDETAWRMIGYETRVPREGRL